MVNGEGAREYGGRWNPPGIAAVYTSENLSLATLEILVHAQFANVLPQYSYLKLEVDEGALDFLDPETIGELPQDAAGGDYLRDKLGFIVPSAVMPVENNIVLNPMHPHWDRLVTYGDLAALPIDPRLL